MKDDPIIDEIRQVRETHAARFNYDLRAIYHDLKKQEKQSHRTFITSPPRHIQPADSLSPIHEAPGWVSHVKLFFIDVAAGPNK